MTRMLNLKSFAVVLTLLLAACGGDSGSSKSAETETLERSYSHTSGACGAQIVTYVEEIFNSCEQRSRRCEERVAHFTSNYPSANCEAKLSSGRTFLVTKQSILAVQSGMSSSGLLLGGKFRGSLTLMTIGGGGPRVERCSAHIQVDHSARGTSQTMSITQVGCPTARNQAGFSFFAAIGPKVTSEVHTLTGYGASGSISTNSIVLNKEEASLSLKVDERGETKFFYRDSYYQISGNLVKQ